MRFLLTLAVTVFLTFPVAAETTLERGAYLVNGIAGCGEDALRSLILFSS